jgi:hypothetical protein
MSALSARTSSVRATNLARNAPISSNSVGESPSPPDRSSLRGAGSVAVGSRGEA